MTGGADGRTLAGMTKDPNTDPEHPDLFDAMAAKEEAMRRVDEHADDDWKAAAAMAALEAAQSLPELTSDDVIERIPDSFRTHELRALGPVMMRAAKWGWIVKADRAGRNSRRSSLHASPRTVWRSLLYTGEVAP